MKKEKMIFAVALVALGIFVSYTSPSNVAIAFGHLLSVGSAYVFGLLQKSK